MLTQIETVIRNRPDGCHILAQFVCTGTVTRKLLLCTSEPSGSSKQEFSRGRDLAEGPNVELFDSENSLSPFPPSQSPHSQFLSSSNSNRRYYFESGDLPLGKSRYTFHHHGTVTLSLDKQGKVHMMEFNYSHKRNEHWIDLSKKAVLARRKNRAKSPEFYI
jgi:hypothetical protein